MKWWIIELELELDEILFGNSYFHETSTVDARAITAAADAADEGDVSSAIVMTSVM